jgi:hypothetical protein
MDEVLQLIRQAKGLLARAEQIALERAQPSEAVAAQGGNGFSDPQSAESWLRFYRFLRAVEKEGPEGVDADRQRELLLSVGYSDARAGGGFFNGVNPSMRRDSDTDQRYLTEGGLAFIPQGRARFGDAIDEPYA